MKLKIEVEFDEDRDGFSVRAVEIETPLWLSDDARYDILKQAKKAVGKAIQDELENP